MTGMTKNSSVDFVQANVFNTIVSTGVAKMVTKFMPAPPTGGVGGPPAPVVVPKAVKAVQAIHFISKLPQFVGDINSMGGGWLASNLSSGITDACNAYGDRVSQVYALFQDYVANPLADSIGCNADDIKTGTTVLAITAFSGLFGGASLTFTMLALQGVNIAADYAIKYDYGHPLLNHALKPILGLGTQAINFWYTPGWPLKALEGARALREATDYYEQYKIFTVTDEQFPKLKSLGYSATSILKNIQNASDKEVRDSYNSYVSKGYREYFQAKARLEHSKGTDGNFTELAVEASKFRGEVKNLHQTVTSIGGFTFVKIRDSIMSRQKKPMSIDNFYSAFKTGGKNLGLENNGFDKKVDLATKIIEEDGTVTDEMKKIYPAHISDEAMGCMSWDGKSDITTKDFEVCKNFFDIDFDA